MSGQEERDFKWKIFKSYKTELNIWKKKNQYLKSLLENAGISYDIPLSAEKQSIFDPDQGARILPKEIKAEDANAFFSMFWGRTDVYSKRSVKKSSGEVSYYTQCYNFWKNGCPRINGSKIKCQDCDKRAYKKLEKQQIIAHLKGVAEDASDVIGIYPLLEDETCRFIVFDFDNHEKDAEKQEANSIFDVDNYSEIYKRDLIEASKEIIISSPAIGGKKVDELIELLREKQEVGVKIRIVTWKPDMYGYGDSSYWMELQERMRRQGFEMNLVENYCQHYCIVDRMIVWYGSMNFLGKEDSGENL